MCGEGGGIRNKKSENEKGSLFVKIVQRHITFKEEKKPSKCENVKRKGGRNNPVSSAGLKKIQSKCNQEKNTWHSLQSVWLENR